MIKVHCPCGKVLNVKDEYAGKRGKCPSCGATNQIPQLAAASTPVASTAPAAPRVAVTTAKPTASPVRAQPVAAAPVARSVPQASAAVPVASAVSLDSTADDGMFSGFNFSQEDLDSTYQLQKPAEANPFQAPQTALPSYSAPRERVRIEPASIGSRFVNNFIDQLVLRGLGFVTGMLFAGAMVDSIEVNASGEPQLPFSLILVSIMISLGYFWVLEVLTGQTLGKMATGTRVVDKHGNKPSVGQITIRTLARCIIIIDALCVLGPQKRTLHDMLSGTYVV